MYNENNLQYLAGNCVNIAASGSCTIGTVPAGQKWTIKYSHLNSVFKFSGGRSGTALYNKFRLNCTGENNLQIVYPVGAVITTGGGSTEPNYLNGQTSGGHDIKNAKCLAGNIQITNDGIEALNDNFAYITYWPYDINATSTMATDTPYTISCTVSGNNEYCYNPLIAQIGITALILVSVTMVILIMRSFRKI